MITMGRLAALVRARQAQARNAALLISRKSAGLAVGTALLVGCTPASADHPVAPEQAVAGSARATASPAPAAADLSFSYRAKGGDEYIDQTLLVTNKSTESVVPTLVITPVDSAGTPVAGVSVTTAYGSDQGTLVVPPGRDGGYDILAFSGPDRARVAGVTVTVAKVLRAAAPAAAESVTAQAADQDGNPLSKFDRFQEVVLRNPNSTAVSVRTVYIVYDQPSDGASQQAVAVVPIGGLVTVPAKGTVTVPVAGEAQGAVARYSGGAAVSIKTYPSQ